MKKTKLFLSIAALALVFSLGACGDVTINVGDVDVDLGSESSEDSGSDTSSEGGETGDEGGSSIEEGIVFGFELDGVLNGIDGAYILKDDGTPYLYELTYTSNLNDALKFTYEEGENLGEYYISTEIDEVETWVAIVTSGTFNNVNYVTEKTPLYWNPTYECWGNQEQTHFLCQNSTFGCLYCSSISEYGPNGSKGVSPIAGLYNTDGSKVTGFVGEEIEQEQLPSSEVTYVGGVTEGTYKFGAFDTTSWSYLYISTGVSTASNHYLIPTSDWTYGANISITSYEDGYTLSYQLGEETRYITYTGSSTAVTTSTDPYVWYYDSDNAVFTSAAENGRFLGLAANADAFRAFSYNNNGLTTYAHAIPYNTEPTPDEKPNVGGDDDEDKESVVCKLGALDSTEYCYRYFNGTTTGTTFLNTTTEWDGAVEVYITAVDDNIENSCTLSFIDTSGNTKYISNSSSTSVTLADDPCVWVWNNSLEVFAQGSSSGRVLVLYTDGSFRGYAQNDTNLAYPHVYAYTEAQTNPEPPEVTTTYEQVSSLGDGGEFYAGGYSSNNLYLTTGSISGYNFPTSKDLDSCVPFTITGNAIDGYKLTCSDGKYVYAYDTGSFYDFGTSNATTVPSSGTNIFYWNDTASTLYCNGSDVRTTARYTYVYFEFFSSNVCAYGTNTLNASTSNLAHFYQQVTA